MRANEGNKKGKAPGSEKLRSPDTEHFPYFAPSVLQRSHWRHAVWNCAPICAGRGTRAGLPTSARSGGSWFSDREGRRGRAVRHGRGSAARIRLGRHNGSGRINASSVLHPCTSPAQGCAVNRSARYSISAAPGRTPPGGVTICSAIGSTRQSSMAVSSTPDCRSSQARNSGCRASPLPARKAGARASALFTFRRVGRACENSPCVSWRKRQFAPLRAYMYCRAVCCARSRGCLGRPRA